MADIRFQALNAAGVNIAEINGKTIDLKTGGEVAIGAAGTDDRITAITPGRAEAPADADAGAIAALIHRIDAALGEDGQLL